MNQYLTINYKLVDLCKGESLYPYSCIAHVVGVRETLRFPLRSDYYHVHRSVSVKIS